MNKDGVLKCIFNTICTIFHAFEQKYRFIEGNISTFVMLSDWQDYTYVSIVETGKVAPHVKNFRAGNYDVITINDGDLAVAGGILDITVDATPTGDSKIQLFDVKSFNITPFDRVLVNGVDITANDDVFAGEAKFAYLPDTGELLYLVDGTGIDSETADVKAIKSREYYDLSGKAVSATTKGFVIVKTIYEDGSAKNTKVIK